MLRFTSELATSVLEDLPLGLWVAAAPSGQVVYVNRAFRRILGMDAVGGADIGDAPAVYGIYDRQGRHYPVERLPFSQALERRGPVIVDDLVIHRHDGSRAYIRAFATPLGTQGELEHIVVVFSDITEEVRTEQERQSAEQKLAFAIQHAPVVLWMIDRDGVITLSDGAALSVLGFRPGELVGRSVFDLYRDEPELLANTRRALQGEPISTLTELPGSISMQAHLAPIRGPDGDVLGAIGVATDVTASRRLERRIIQDDGVRALGTLAASVAHEINNPLTYVIGNLEVAAGEIDDVLAALAQDGPDLVQRARGALQEVRQLLDDAQTGADRVRRVSRELSTLSRRDEGAGGTADVTGTVQAAIQLVRREVSARARLMVDLQPCPRVRIDQSRLVQVLLNLLRNAWQALPEPDPARHEVAVRARPCGDGAVVEVTDTGTGIPAADRERIFDAFVTTKPAGQGTGLGLFVCRSIVRSVGGEITADETPGGGALLRVVLPGARDPAPEPLAAPAPPLRATTRALVVDDEPLVASVLCTRLRSGGFEARALDDAGRALEALLADPGIALVYCDVMMQGMSGLELYRALEARAPALLPRLVLMTGGAFTEEARAFLDAHRDVAVEKPFDILSDARRRLPSD